MQTLIRKYVPADKETLVEAFQSNIPIFFALEELNDLLDYLDRFGEPTYWVMECNEKVVGGFGVESRLSDKSGRINWIFFHANEKGKGLGKQAVAFAIGILKADKNVEKLIVRTSQVAFAFFEKMGYSLTSIEKDYWAKGLDLYLMERGIGLDILI